MPTDIVASHVARTNRNMLLLNGGLLAVVLIAAALTSGYYYNVFFGPFKVDKSNVLAVSQKGWFARKYLTADLGELFDSGKVYHVKEDSNESFYHFMFAELSDNQWILLKTGSYPTNDAENVPTRQTGWISGITSEIHNEVIDANKDKMPDGAHIADVMFDASEGTVGGWIGLIIGGLVGLVALRNVGTAIIRTGDPQRHPIYKGLAVWGDPKELTDDLNADLSGQVERVGKATLGRRWLISPFGMGLKASRLDDLIWMYKRTVKSRGGKTTYLMLCHAQAGAVEVPLKEALIPTLMGATAHRVPWVIQGYDASLANMWKKDRQQMIATANERRQKHQAAASAQSAAQSAPPPAPAIPEPPAAEIPPMEFSPPSATASPPPRHDEPGIGL